MDNEKILLYKKAAEYIKGKIGGVIPFASVVLGSGLNVFENFVRVIECIPFDSIPGYSRATVQGHKGELCLAAIDIADGEFYVLLQKGRFHYYEGYGSFEITFPIRTSRLIGISHLILTNAAGGINKDFNVGDLMLIRDHIGLFAPSPLRGENLSEFGPRFNDMTYAYDIAVRNIAKKTASKLGINLKEGVYAFAQGPMYETPAEIKALSLLGADAVGMSTVPEAIVAAHCSMKIAGISLITNMAAGITDVRLSHDDVASTSKKAGNKFSEFLKQLLEDWYNYELDTMQQ